MQRLYRHPRRRDARPCRRCWSRCLVSMSTQRLSGCVLKLQPLRRLQQPPLRLPVLVLLVRRQALAPSRKKLLLQQSRGECPVLLLSLRHQAALRWRLLHPLWLTVQQLQAEASPVRAALRLSLRLRLPTLAHQ